LNKRWGKRSAIKEREGRQSLERRRRGGKKEEKGSGRKIADKKEVKRRTSQFRDQPLDPPDCENKKRGGGYFKERG